MEQEARTRFVSDHRRVIAIIVGVLLVSCAFTAGLWRYVSNERKFDPGDTLTHSNVTKSFVEKTGIAIIGDSWIKPELASVISSYLATNLNRTYEAQCLGHPGGKSRQIYRNLTKEWSTILTNEVMKYCVVIVGVNDCGGHIGADFYTHHVLVISQLLLKSGITPVIVDVPDFDIAHMDYSNLGSRFKRPLYRFLFDGGKENVISDYRSKLHQSLRTANLDKVVIVVPFDSFIDAYSNHKELYRNASHLNVLGTKELARHIAKVIVASEQR